jgi:hypothetical protein
MIALPELAENLDAPIAPLRGTLKLTGAQERELMRLIKTRIGTATANYSKSGWLEKRTRAMQQYMGNMEARRDPGSIFELSNISLNLPKRFVRITAARIYDSMLTSSPILGITVEGKGDDHEVARVIERYVGHQIERSGIRSVLREAETLACIRGETVVKTTWERRVSRSRKKGTVLIRESKPVRARDGNLVRQDDTWVNEKDDLVLARDRRIRITPDDIPVWEEQEYDYYRVTFDGLEASCIDHRDFICNTTEKDIHSSDFIAVRMDMELDRVAAMLAPVKDTIEAKNLLRKMKSTASEEGGQYSAKAEFFRGEETRSQDALPICELAEIYMRVVLTDDGIADEIALLVDLRNDQIIAYDYLDNISPTGQRPLRVIRMEPVPHRWYGTGYYELFEDRHKFCDLFINRVNLAASLSGNIKIENPMATEEGMAGEPIEFGTNKTYRLREGFTADDVFKCVTIPNDSNASENLLNMLMQVTQLEAGIVSAGDHGLAGLPAASLATGIRSLDRVANVLLKNMLYDIVDGFEWVLKDCVALTLKNYDPFDAERLMGEQSAELLSKHRDFTQLQYQVKMLLSNSKDSDVVEAHKQAFDILIGYEQLPPEPKVRIRPIIYRILQTMGIEDVDKALGAEAMAAEAALAIMPSPEEMQQIANNAQQAPPPSPEEISATLDNAPATSDENVPRVPATYTPPPKEKEYSPIEDGQMMPTPERAE